MHSRTTPQIIELIGFISLISRPPALPVQSQMNNISIFFFNGTATTEIYTLSLHDALPISGTSAVSDKLLDLVGLGGKSAADKGKDTRDYLAAAFPELNAWERAGADASSAGMVDAGFENQKELTKMQLDNQKEIAEM